MDDPHILISGNCKVRFVLEGHDNFFAANDRGAENLFKMDTMS